MTVLTLKFADRITQRQRHENIFPHCSSTFLLFCICVTIYGQALFQHPRIFIDNATISGGNVRYVAGKSVELGTGFQAQSGAVFTAQIGDSPP